MNEKIALHLKSPFPDANVWFDYYESQPGLMVGGVEADGLQQTDGSYSFFREGQVADGATFGTAWMYFTLGYAVDQDGNPLSETDIANFYGYDSLDEIGDVEEAFEELASYGAPCYDFWQELVNIFDTFCYPNSDNICIISNEDNEEARNSLKQFYRGVMRHVIFNHPTDGIPDAQYMSDDEKNQLLDEMLPVEMRMELALEFFEEIN